jgi:hypothetical protein
MSAAAAEVGAMRYTIFFDRFAFRKQDMLEPWEAITARLKNGTPARCKDDLSLLSLGVYGNKRTAGNALRSQENLLSITGVEGDYDSGKVEVEDAAERLALAGIRCVLHTSPSHKPEKPRWRVLAPLSREYQPRERARFVARINGILGGILTGESFTASQSFYFGQVQDGEYSQLVLDGDCIDTRDEFDAHAIMPAGKTASDGGVSDKTTDDNLRAGIRSGDNFHEALRGLAARLTGRGMNEVDTRAVLEGLMAESAEAGSPRWRARYDEIPRLVETAAGKFRDSRQTVATPTPPDRELPPIEAYADDATPAGEVEAPPSEARRFDRQAALMADCLDTPPDPPELIVQGLHAAHRGRASVGAGGGGKSTHDLYEAIRISRSAEPLYGLEVLRPGPVLILTAEDARPIVALWRLHRMAHDMAAVAAGASRVPRSSTCTSKTRPRFPARFVDCGPGRPARADPRCSASSPTSTNAAKLSAIFADPMNAFGPGERFVNDGEAELMRAGAWLSRDAQLRRAVRPPHRQGRCGRAGITDQYAGRGGSAGADNARFLHLLDRARARTATATPHPRRVSG